MSDWIDDFVAFVDLVRFRLREADESLGRSNRISRLFRAHLREANEMSAERLCSFKQLLSDRAGLVPEEWYWRAFDELAETQQLTPDSVKTDDGDALGRLSDAGLYYLKAHGI